MESQLQELLETIRRDGVQAAEQEGKDIVAAAQKQADALLQEAREQERDAYAEAQKNIAEWQRSATKQVEHAAQNVIIAVKAHVVGLFDALLHKEVAGAVSAEQFGAMVAEAIGAQLGAVQGRTVQVAGDADILQNIERYLHARLQPSLARNVSFSPLPKSTGRIQLAFDRGHSTYEVSHDSIVRSMQELLAPSLRRLLDGMVAQGGADVEAAGEHTDALSSEGVQGADVAAQGGANAAAKDASAQRNESVAAQGGANAAADDARAAGGHSRVASGAGAQHGANAAAKDDAARSGSVAADSGAAHTTADAAAQGGANAAADDDAARSESTP